MHWEPERKERKAGVLGWCSPRVFGHREVMSDRGWDSWTRVERSPGHYQLDYWPALGYQPLSICSLLLHPLRPTDFLISTTVLPAVQLALGLTCSILSFSGFRLFRS